MTRRPMDSRSAWMIALLTIGLGCFLACAEDDDLARELPRIKPLGPEAALRSFKVHEGFRLVPVAVESIVTDPVSLCYDADGRAYVVEMRGYPYPENSPTGNVSRLEDTDGDGRFDRSTIFVDGLSWPTSVVPYDGGVFIAVAPDILYAKDTDGDGVADVKKVVFTGFGTQNVQALVNGLLWGPDGWIYGVSGGNGGEIKDLTRPDAKPVSVRGRDFRFKPDGSAFEAISGGGQFGHSFDDWGHRFTCNNSNHIRQIVLPSRYLDRNPALLNAPVIAEIPSEGPAAPVYRISPPEPWRVVRTRQRAADPAVAKRLPPTELVATGFFTSATGVTIYRGTAYPPEYRGNAFIGDVGGNLVHRKVLTRKGATFLATRADEGVEFLASPDNWFRPVNFANTPNGTLLVLDMYRETIEHPASIPEPIKKHLDLTSGKDLGRIYEIVPEAGVKVRKPALSKATTAELVAHLTDDDAWWRETAQRLLIERRDPAAPKLLAELASQKVNPLSRMHALWTLEALGELGHNRQIVFALHNLLRDPDPAVREQAARLTEGRIEELLEPLAALANDPEPMVRFQAALSLGDVDDPLAISALADIAVRDAGDRWTRLAILTARPGRAAALIDRLASISGFFEKPEGSSLLGDLATQAGAENRVGDVKAVMERFARPGVSERQLRLVLVNLGRGLLRSGGSLRDALREAGSDRLTGAFDQAAKVATSDGPSSSRSEAIRLLGLGPIDRAMEVLPGLLDARQPVGVQLSALQTLAELPDRRVGEAIIAHWKALGPTARGEAIEALFARPARIAALLEAIESKAIASSDIDSGRRKQLLAHRDPAIRDRAARLVGGETQSNREQAIATYRKALALEGDLEKGRAVFRKTCATCHRAEGQGIDVGPNLATVTGRTPEDLLIHILDPNREVPPIYINYNVATTDGRVVSGLIADESTNALTLKRSEGVTDVIPRNRIESIASTGLSLMPEGLETGLEPQQMADLIAYIRGIQAVGVPATSR